VDWDESGTKRGRGLVWFKEAEDLHTSRRITRARVRRTQHMKFKK